LTSSEKLLFDSYLRWSAATSATHPASLSAWQVSQMAMHPSNTVLYDALRRVDQTDRKEFEALGLRCRSHSDISASGLTSSTHPWADWIALLDKDTGCAAGVAAAAAV